MAAWLAGRVDAHLPGPSRILVLGLTFKENVPDLRNSGAAELVRELTGLGHAVAVHDPHADPAEARAQYGVELLGGLDGAHECVVGAVAHGDYDKIDAAGIGRLMPEGGLLADIKGMWRNLAPPPGVTVWRP
jgi:UDP-N-acetyl-D-galactosamine dehydrogenase